MPSNSEWIASLAHDIVERYSLSCCMIKLKSEATCIATTSRLFCPISIDIWATLPLSNSTSRFPLCITVKIIVSSSPNAFPSACKLCGRITVAIRRVTFQGKCSIILWPPNSRAQDLCIVQFDTSTTWSRWLFTVLPRSRPFTKVHAYLEPRLSEYIQSYATTACSKSVIMVLLEYSRCCSRDALACCCRNAFAYWSVTRFVNPMLPHNTSLDMFSGERDSIVESFASMDARAQYTFPILRKLASTWHSVTSCRS